MDFNIFLFDEFETLDIFGPIEVLARKENHRINYYSLDCGIIVSRQGAKIITDKISNANKNGVLVFPGGISLYIYDNKIGELGWIINKSYWKQGYATEAARALMEYAITELGIKHFIAHCDSENVGSYSVMKSLGMVLKNKTLGRKNRASDENRVGLEYEYVL